jgi:hypothetical protein
MSLPSSLSNFLSILSLLLFARVPQGFPAHTGRGSLTQSGNET